jgi:hypothetical protein
LSLLLYLAVQPVRWKIHFDAATAAGSGASGYPSVFSIISVSIRNAEAVGDSGSGVFIADEGDAVEDKELGDNTSQCTDTLGGLDEHVPQISMMMLFSGFKH